jgi:hypothetical protein
MTEEVQPATGFPSLFRMRMKLVAPAFVWNKIELTVVIVKAFRTTRLHRLIA